MNQQEEIKEAARASMIVLITSEIDMKKGQRT